MTPLAQDVADVTEAATDLGALLLLSQRHMRTQTGRSLLVAVRSLANRVYDAERTAAIDRIGREDAEKREQEQRELVAKLLDREAQV